ncbi:hypothetical protein BH23ACT3_BH23ACT3_12730 [soil metagenome]
MTWRDDVGGGEYEPVRAGWEILDSARSIAFTGEIEFPLLPIAHVYLDRGRIYYAARADHPDVADRLVAMGVVRPDDLFRGVMVSAGIDHLGRLFDRLPSLDQQRVMLALEQVTHETTAWVASQSVGAAVTRPYVYHPSGVHQWYARPVTLAPANVFPAPLVRERPAPRPSPPSSPSPPSPTSAPLTDVEVDQAEPSVPSVPSAPSEAFEPFEPSVPSVTVDVGAQGLEFELRWPSGEVGVPERPAPVEPPSAADGLDRFDRVDPGAPVTDAESVTEATDDLDDAEHHEMTIAVRRAMAAVASGTARGRPVATVVPVLDDDPDPFDRWSGTPAEHDEPDRDSDDGRPEYHPDDPFMMPVERPAAGSSPLAPPLPSERRLVDERRSALQRLIDGLRSR